jgi:hypothetical protein
MATREPDRPLQRSGIARGRSASLPLKLHHHPGHDLRRCSKSYAMPQPLRRIDLVADCMTRIAHDQARVAIVKQTLVCGAARFSISTRQLRKSHSGTCFGNGSHLQASATIPRLPTGPMIPRVRERLSLLARRSSSGHGRLSVGYTAGRGFTMMKCLRRVDI